MQDGTADPTYGVLQVDGTGMHTSYPGQHINVWIQIARGSTHQIGTVDRWYTRPACTDSGYRCHMDSGSRILQVDWYTGYRYTDNRRDGWYGTQDYGTGYRIWISIGWTVV